MKTLINLFKKEKKSTILFIFIYAAVSVLVTFTTIFLFLYLLYDSINSAAVFIIIVLFYSTLKPMLDNILKEARRI